MSEENVRIVRRIFRVWAEQGSPVPSGLLDPEIEWVNPDDAVEAGVRRGVDQFASAAGTVADTWSETDIEFERFMDAGDKVVAIGVFKGTGRESGVQVERRQGYVWTIRDGLAVRFEFHNDPAQALASAGLDEDGTA